MEKKRPIKFKDFLEFFPEIELPVTLTEGLQIEFSRHNKVFPKDMTRVFLESIEEEEADEFTEYIPCFRLKETQNFYALVIWKASLLTYEYFLVTFTGKGIFINKRVIAGTKSKDSMLVRSVATIDEDWIIHIVGGVAESDIENYEASNSQSFNLELLANGQIVTSN